MDIQGIVRYSTIPYISTTYGYNIGVDDFYEQKKAIITRSILAVFLKETVFRFEQLRKIKNWIFNFSPEILSKSSLRNVDANYVTNRIISWISDNKDNPFFIYAHYEGGHSPYDAPNVVKKQFVSDISFPQITHPSMLMTYDKNSPSYKNASL